MSEQEMFQSVWIKFSDGTKAGFIGKAIAFEGDTRIITEVTFTPPKPLPPNCRFESLDIKPEDVA